MMRCDPIREFANEVHCNMGAVIDPIPDGEPHRFDDPDGKPRNRAGWYILHADGLPVGIYGSWISGTKFQWRAGSTELSSSERSALNDRTRRARRARECRLLTAQVNAARCAAELWNAAEPASTDHPYLCEKRVSAEGLRQVGDTLLVPLFSIEGDLVNLQRIGADGSKRFLRGGATKGHFHLVGPMIPKTGALYIAEGVATAKTVSADLHLPVVAAMNAGNLLPVAKALHSKYPSLTLEVAGDEDWRTPGNPGRLKAMEAARAVGGSTTFPFVCMEYDCLCTDFNDLSNCGRASQ